MAHRTRRVDYSARDGSTEDRQRHGEPALAGGFMAAFLAAGMVLSLVNPALLRWPNAPLLDGSWAAAYQEAFDQNSLLLEPATTVWGVLEYVLFREGREGVLVGSDGWLYSSEEFEFPVEAAAEEVLAHDFAAVASVRQRLAADGVDLVVALLPAKARLYPEHLGRYRLPTGSLERYRLALTGLRSTGTVTVDLLPAMELAKAEAPVFLRTDTHWTPHGAAAAAGAVATVVADLEEYEWLHSVAYATERHESAPYRGDLTGFLPLGDFYEELGPPDDLLAEATTAPTEGAGANLFAEVELPVALVGTSYSRDERWNFAGWLRQELGSDVLVAAQEGEGPYPPMLDYLEGEAYRAARPEVVVWEIPERYLGRAWSGGGERR